MKFFAIGEDKSLIDVTELVLALAGGSMTGNIGFDSGVRNGDIIKFIAGNASGSGIAIGDGGTTIIGGGNSAQTLLPVSGEENKMIVAGDQGIDFYVNCQSGAANATKVTLGANGMLSGHQKTITSGTAAPTGGSNGDIYIQY